MYYICILCINNSSVLLLTYPNSNIQYCSSRPFLKFCILYKQVSLQNNPVDLREMVQWWRMISIGEKLSGGVNIVLKCM